MIIYEITTRHTHAHTHTHTDTLVQSEIYSGNLIINFGQTLYCMYLATTVNHSSKNVCLLGVCVCVCVSVTSNIPHHRHTRAHVHRQTDTHTHTHIQREAGREIQTDIHT